MALRGPQWGTCLFMIVRHKGTEGVCCWPAGPPRASDGRQPPLPFSLAFGTLYPAYSSYKAVKTKNVKEYVKWMMYWIVFALFSTAETVTDMVLSWFPFYFELKIAFVIWLLSPYTKGSSVLYRKFVHPTLSNKEKVPTCLKCLIYVSSWKSGTLTQGSEPVQGTKTKNENEQNFTRNGNENENQMVFNCSRTEMYSEIPKTG
ncbi:Receptor expression-enhancing protein 2 [Merluccius polli]|uniref:Receptor expression-enhancing protein n=1 Tax=Merluccius polli TaxID=89951 RepID=A0AA47N4W7_MERPO|nr:Receptor expression-enhancing protein 2 [Merluccius polli]